MANKVEYRFTDPAQAIVAVDKVRRLEADLIREEESLLALTQPFVYNTLTRNRVYSGNSEGINTVAITAATNAEYGTNFTDKDIFRALGDMEKSGDVKRHSVHYDQYLLKDTS